MTAPNEKKLTQCVHSGGDRHRTIGAVVTPVYMASSYRVPPAGDELCYPRYYNIPNQMAAADKLAALENGESGLVVGSGMAAITETLFALLRAGDHAVFQGDIYGGTYHFILSELERYGIDYSIVTADSVDAFVAACRENTRLIYFETPTNPLLTVVDVQAMAEAARRRGILTVVDNTFATPINQNPLALGVDVVIHSGTKYLGGHSDLCCGAIVTRRDLMDKIRGTAVNHGAVLGAFECYLLERSMKTLALRVRQHNQNAQAVAEFLSGHPRVRRVYYPGLPSDRGHEVARRQMSGFGGMLSVDLTGDHASAREAMERLRWFTHAVSLGGVESLFCFPVLTSHAKMPREDREKLGITDTLVRLSVGVEETDDLIDDLKQALSV